MKPALANEICFSNPAQTGERASIRIVLLALVSFFLGVAATALWFHHTAKRNAENPGVQANGQPAVQPVAPAANAGSPSQPVVANPPTADPAIIMEVKRAVPNYASVSVADGEKILRQTALQEFAEATRTMDVQVKQAQQQLVRAENGQSEAEQQAALKHLQQTQAAESEKLQQVAAHLHAQIAAWKKIKNVE
jgi:hypothetical protein